MGQITDLDSAAIPDVFNPTSGNLTINGITFGSVSGSTVVNLSGTSAGNSVVGGIGGGTGTIAVAKIGTSTWTFSASNSYSGTTTVSAGTLFANNASSSTGTGAVSVFGTGKLAGNGTIAGTVTLYGSATAEQGGIIGAGANATTAGTLTSGGQSWNGGGAYAWKINNIGSSATAGTGASSTLTVGSETNDNLVMPALTVASGNTSQPVTIVLSNLSTLTSSSPGTPYSWTIAQVTGGAATLPAGVAVPASTTLVASTDNLLTDTAGGTKAVFARHFGIYHRRHQRDQHSIRQFQPRIRRDRLGRQPGSRLRRHARAGHGDARPGRSDADASLPSSPQECDDLSVNCLGVGKRISAGSLDDRATDVEIPAIRC